MSVLLEHIYLYYQSVYFICIEYIYYKHFLYYADICLVLLRLLAIYYAQNDGGVLCIY